jgi:hypothetical protein
LGHVIGNHLSGLIGAEIIDNDNAVNEVGHGGQDFGDLGFFVVAGDYDGDGFIVEHGGRLF